MLGLGWVATGKVYGGPVFLRLGLGRCIATLEIVGGSISLGNQFGRNDGVDLNYRAHRNRIFTALIAMPSFHHPDPGLPYCNWRRAICCATVALLPILSVCVAGWIDAPVAQAQAPAPRVRYIPNKKRPLPRRTEAAGTRGCALDGQAIQVNLLVPTIEPLPQTQSDHPTFSWYVANPPKLALTLQFSLIEPGKTRPVYQQQLSNHQSGVMQLTLPDQIPGLEVGKPYRWSIAWGCNPNRVSEQMYQRAWIERSPINPPPQLQLQQTTSASERLVVYAQSGIWYDAIALAANHKTDPKMQAYWQTLLQDGGLTLVPGDEQLVVRTNN
jgi:Domain of Unknown Function (DUF928)